jgi:hypothetical protein
MIDAPYLVTVGSTSSSSSASASLSLLAVRTTLFEYNELNTHKRIYYTSAAHVFDSRDLRTKMAYYIHTLIKCVSTSTKVQQTLHSHCL